MKISVIGCGRWGSFIAWYLDRAGHDIMLYGREGSKNLQRFIETRTNDYLTMPESVAFTSDLDKALESGVIIISISSQSLDALTKQIAAKGIKDRDFVLCMKGLEIGTCRRLSQVARENLDPSCGVAVWVGPGHVQDFTKGVPNCMVIDSEDDNLKRRLVDAFSSDLIRFYYGTDLIGNEIGAASKNVIGIAAGMLDGFGVSSLKGALMSRGTREIAKLIKAMGGSELSAYGLCHLGDYEATVFSPHSNNRRFGEMYVKGEKFEKLAEGYYTAEAMHQLSQRTGVELPICELVYDVLYEGRDPKLEMDNLFRRSIKDEFIK